MIVFKRSAVLILAVLTIIALTWEIIFFPFKTLEARISWFIGLVRVLY